MKLRFCYVVIHLYSFNRHFGIIYYTLVMLGTTVFVSYLYKDFKQKHSRELVKVANKFIK